MAGMWLLLLGAAPPFFAGAVWFSFMNVAARRLPVGDSPLRGRSHCPVCGHRLGAADLIPVCSWLLLRGRCRYCGAPIPVRELLVELLGGAAALLCRWRYGPAVSLREGAFGLCWAALAALVVCGLLTAIALADADAMLIPDPLVLALGAAALGTLPLASGAWPGLLVDRLAGFLCVSVPMALLCRAVPGAFGFGDIKLMAAAGLLLGWRSALIAFLLAVLGGGAWGVFLLLCRRLGPGGHFAFGPFLCGGIALALLFGEPLWRWYWAGFPALA